VRTRASTRQPYPPLCRSKNGANAVCLPVALSLLLFSFSPLRFYSVTAWQNAAGQATREGKPGKGGATCTPTLLCDCMCCHEPCHVHRWLTLCPVVRLADTGNTKYKHLVAEDTTYVGLSISLMWLCTVSSRALFTPSLQQAHGMRRSGRRWRQQPSGTTRGPTPRIPCSRATSKRWVECTALPSILYSPSANARRNLQELPRHQFPAEGEGVLDEGCVSLFVCKYKIIPYPTACKHPDIRNARIAYFHHSSRSLGVNDLGEPTPPGVVVHYFSFFNSTP